VRSAPSRVWTQKFLVLGRVLGLCWLAYGSFDFSKAGRSLPAVELVPFVRPDASRIVVRTPVACTVLVTRPLASRKVIGPPDADAEAVA
jgi:hypothetical protein